MNLTMIKLLQGQKSFYMCFQKNDPTQLSKWKAFTYQNIKTKNSKTIAGKENIIITFQV